MSQNFTICTIIKNEEKNLDRFLSALKKHKLLNQLLIADTGSSDKSLQLLQKHGITPLVYEWQEDFAAAKNFVAEKAATDWILLLDADEFLEKMDLNFIQQWLRKNQEQPSALPPLGRIRRVNETPKGNRSEKITRFYNKKYFHYEGKIHEQLTPVKPEERAVHSYDLPVQIFHVGYRAGIVKDKALRDLRLLEKEISETKLCKLDGTDISVQKSTEKSSENEDKLSYLYYNAGRCHRILEDNEAAKASYEKALQISQPSGSLHSWQRDLIDDYAYCLMDLKKNEEALAIENYYDQACDRADYLLALGLVYMHNNRLNDALMAFTLASETPDAAAEGANSYLPLYNAGLIYEFSGNTPMAIKTYERAKTFPDAKKRLNLLRRMP
ncbi:MAG: glycosyltransferase [Lachnospiraceae bacterium]|nr:glycosyltransferase [Lachnospiraceae bacterium]